MWTNQTQHRWSAVTDTRQNSRQRTSLYTPSGSPERRSEARAEIIIDGTASEMSAFAFLASQESSVRHKNDTPGSTGKIPNMLQGFPRLRTQGRESTFSPNSQNVGLAKTFEDSPENSHEESISAPQPAEGDNDEFCSIKFDPQVPEFKLKSESRETPDFGTLVEQCRLAFLRSEQSASLERWFAILSLVGRCALCETTLRSLLGVSTVLSGVIIEKYSSLGNIDIPFPPFAISFINYIIGQAKTAIIARSYQGLRSQHIIFQSIGLAILPMNSLALSAAYLGYACVKHTCSSEFSLAPIVSILLILFRILFATIVNPSRIDDYLWIENCFALPLLLATWIAVARAEATTTSDTASVQEENGVLTAEVARLNSNMDQFFTDNQEAMIICQARCGQSTRQQTTNKITRVLRVNEGFRQLFFGLTLPSAFSKKTLQQVTQSGEGRTVSLQSAIASALSQESAILYKIRIPGASEVQYIYITTAPIFFDENDALLVKVQRVSHIIEQQTKRMQGVFQEALIATLQHEQLNPLNSIINLSSLARDYYSDKTTQLEQCLTNGPVYEEAVAELEEAQRTLKWTKIIQNSSIMMQLLNAAILNQGLIDSGKFRPTYDNVKNPLEIATKLTDLFEEHAAAQSLTVTVLEVRNASSAKPLVSKRGLVMEVALYEQIIFNILANAFKFNKLHGSVSVRIECKSATEGSRIDLITTIADSGLGMSEPKRKKLGKMFESICLRESTQWPSQPSQSTSGIGLGFSLSQKLASYLGGTITVSSQENMGTEVKITLQFSLGQRASPPASKITRDSFHSIELLQSVQFGSPLPKLKHESPEPQLSSIALNFKNRRTRLRSSTNLKNQAVSNLAIRYEESKFQNEKSFFAKCPNSATQIRSCDSGLNEFSSQIELESPDNLKREFSFANSSGFVDGKLFRKMTGHRMTNQDSLNPSFLESIESQVSVSESSSEDSNFGNLTDSCSPEMVISKALESQLTLSRVKTKTSITQTLSPGEPLRKAQSTMTALFQAQDNADPNFPGPTIMNLASYSKQSTISLQSDSDEEEAYIYRQQDEIAKKLAFKQKPLPQLQRIQEDFEEDNSSVRGLTRKKVGSMLSGPIEACLKTEEEKNDDRSLTLTQDLTNAGQAAFSRLSTPQNKPRESPLTRSPKVAESKNCTASVMLVDDSQFNIATLEVMINVKFSLKCLIAHNGRQAVDLFKQFYVPPSATACPHCEKPGCEFRGIRLVFMDLNMPVMDGFEASEKILAFQGRDRRCTIVALTAFQDPKTRKKCLQIGMKEVLSKPASQQKISETVERYNRTGAKNAQ